MATRDNFHSENMDFNINNNEWISSNSVSFKTPIEEPHGNKKVKKKIKLEIVNCLKCKDLIKDKNLYAIGENYYHKCCVYCDNCKIQIDLTGFIAENTLLCPTCYNQSIYVTKCFGCKLPMKTHDVAMYALKQPFHLSCFKCNYCKHLLSKGDKYVIQNGLMICKQDFENGPFHKCHLTHSIKHQYFTSDNPSESNVIRRKTKISISQRQYLEDYYFRKSIPSIKQRAYISDELNLPSKVVQTWFCNYRTKMKMQRNNELKILNEKLKNNNHNYCTVSNVKRMLEQQCFTPDQDCPTNCQISQSTEDHSSPQDLSSDLSGMYNCPDVGKHSYSHRTSMGEDLSNQDDDEDDEDNPIDESIDDQGLTYADLSNSCVKSIDRSIMAGFSASSSNDSSIIEMMMKSKNVAGFRTQSFAPASFKDISLDIAKSQSKAACLTWS